MFGDDFQRGLSTQGRLLSYELTQKELFRSGDVRITASNTEPTIGLHIGENYFFPLLFQGREGGVSHLIVRGLGSFLSPLNSIRIYQLTLFIVTLILSLKILEKWDLNLTLYKFIFCISPITTFFYGPYLADQLTLTLTLALLYCLLKGKLKAPYLLTLFFVGIFTRVTFLWSILIGLFYSDQKKRYLFLSIFTVCIYTAVSMALNNAGTMRLEFYDDLEIVKGLEYTKIFLLDLFKTIFLGPLSLNYFYRWEYSMLLIAPIVMLGVLKGYLFLRFVPYIRLKHLANFGLYLLMVYFLTYEFSSPIDYFIPLHIFILSFFLYALKCAKSKKITTLFLTLHLSVSMLTMFKYIQKGPTAAIDAKFNNHVAKGLKARSVDSFITNDKYFWGQVTFFSEGEVSELFQGFSRAKLNAPKAILCGYSWGEQLYKEKANCKNKSHGKLFKFNHPRREAFFSLTTQEEVITP